MQSNTVNPASVLRIFPSVTDRARSLARGRWRSVLPPGLPREPARREHEAADPPQGDHQDVAPREVEERLAVVCAEVRLDQMPHGERFPKDVDPSGGVAPD